MPGEWGRSPGPAEEASSCLRVSGALAPAAASPTVAARPLGHRAPGWTAGPGGRRAFRGRPGSCCSPVPGPGSRN